MSLPPLLHPCPTCHGTGMLANPGWMRYFALTGGHLRPADDPDYPRPEGPEEEPCPGCDGAGQVPTSAGAEILALVRWAEGRR